MRSVSRILSPLGASSLVELSECFPLLASSSLAAKASFGFPTSFSSRQEAERTGFSEGSGDKTVDFGFTKVAEEDKERLVAGVFSSVAPSYDIMNDLMSGGLHRLWKDRLVEKLRPFPGMRHLDVAGGTGDVSFRIYEHLRRASASTAAPAPATIVVSDINPAMLQVGRKRAEERGYRSVVEGFEGGEGEEDAGPRLAWVEGNAEALPFPDDYFDSYTIAFGIRNVTHIDRALQDAHRVLRKGGRLLVLEFSSVHPALKPLYDLYSFNVIPQVGKMVANDAESYRYLVESIRRFPDQATFEGMLRAAGFRAVGHENLTAGVVAIHSGFKL